MKKLVLKQTARHTKKTKSDKHMSTSIFSLQEQTLLLVQTLNENDNAASLATTFKIITNRQNVRETLYETVLQISSKKKKTKLATSCCFLRPFYLELLRKTMRDFHSVVFRPFLVAQVSVALFEHSIP